MRSSAFHADESARENARSPNLVFTLQPRKWIGSDFIILINILCFVYFFLLYVFVLPCVLKNDRLMLTKTVDQNVTDWRLRALLCCHLVNECATRIFRQVCSTFFVSFFSVLIIKFPSQSKGLRDGDVVLFVCLCVCSFVRLSPLRSGSCQEYTVIQIFISPYNGRQKI